MCPKLREVGGKEPRSRGAESSSHSRVHLEMSRFFSWMLILLFVAPCHRAGDSSTEPTQVDGVSESTQSVVFTEKYQPSSKSFVAEWSFDKPLWRNMNSTIPQMREGAATWTDPDSGDWWLFGGQRNALNSKVFRATKDNVLKKKRLEKISSKYSTSPRPSQKITTKYFSDMWHYRPSERLWTRVYPSSFSSVPAPGGPDNLLTRPILCGGGGGNLGKNSGEAKNDTNDKDVAANIRNESLAEGNMQKSRGDGRVMAVYAPGSKPVDTVWLLEMNDTRLWTTYVCCDEDTASVNKSEMIHGERTVTKVDGGDIPGKHSVKGSSIFKEQEKSAKDDVKKPSKNPPLEEGPPTFCPDFHTLTRPPITWCDKMSQALFALDITSFKITSEDQKLMLKNQQNTSLTLDKANNTKNAKKMGKTMSWIPRLWRFDLRLTQWDHISVDNVSMFSDLKSCGKDTSTMHWTSLGKCLILLCPAIGRPSNMVNSFSLCMEKGIPSFQTLGTIHLSQGASQARRWSIAAVESSITGRKYLLLAYGRLLDLWVLEKSSMQWSPLENIWQGAALKWFRANTGLYHLQIVEEGLGSDKKNNEEEEEEEVEELEEGRALGIAHVGEIGNPSKTGRRMGNKENQKPKNHKIQSGSKLRDGVMEVFMVNPREGLDASLREQGLFIIRISEDNGTIFGHKTEIHIMNDNNATDKGKGIDSTTLPGQSMDEVLNVTSHADFKNYGNTAKSLSTESSELNMQTTSSPLTKGEENDPESYDQNPVDEDEDDEWSAELVLETNGSSPVLNASLLALVESENHDEVIRDSSKEIGHDKGSLERERINESSTLTHEITTVNEISAETGPLIVETDVDNLDQDQAENMQVVRPLSIAENDLERGGIALGAFGSEEGNGYQGTMLFFSVSFSMFILLAAVVFLRRCVIINCQFASHHLPHRCRSNSSVLLKEPPPIRYSVIPDEVCYAGISSAAMPAPGSPIPPSSIHRTLNRPLTT